MRQELTCWFVIEDERKLPSGSAGQPCACEVLIENEGAALREGESDRERKRERERERDRERERRAQILIYVVLSAECKQKETSSELRIKDKRREAVQPSHTFCM